MKNIFAILKYAKGYKKYALLNILFNILSVVFSLFSIAMLFPFLQLLFSNDSAKSIEIIAKGEPAILLSKMSTIIDWVNYSLAKVIVENGKEKALLIISLFVIINVFLKNVTRYLAMYFLAPVRNGVVKDLRNEVFGKSLKLPLSYYSDERKGDIISRMTVDVKEIEWSVMSSLEMIFRDPIQIIIFLVTMLFLSAKLTLLVLILLPIAGLIIGRISKTLRKTSTKEKELSGVLLSLMEETLSGLRIIKAFNGEKYTNKKFGDVNDEYTNYMNKVYRRVDLSSPVSEFLGVVVLVIVLYIGGAMVLKNEGVMDGAAFISYLAIFAQLIPPAKSLTTAYYNVQKGAASADRIAKITLAPIVIEEDKNPVEIKSFEKEIEYKNISFAYTKGDSGYVLKNVNLTINKGKTIALVGQSGSGKTTLADMLPRFYDTNEGEIYIDGTPLKKASIKSVRNLMGIVSQESILFNDTVLNNIAFGMTNAKEEDVIAAAKIANAHEFIMQMPQGYHTNIGDRGNKMSGGQRQRLSIARAVLKNPPILILDEATSALDTESERLVQDALNKLMQNRTSIVIAHRLSTIQHADEIIVMQKGEIIERGKHAELLNKNGVYKKLFDLQSFV